MFDLDAPSASGERRYPHRVRIWRNDGWVDGERWSQSRTRQMYTRWTRETTFLFFILSCEKILQYHKNQLDEIGDTVVSFDACEFTVNVNDNLREQVEEYFVHVYTCVYTRNSQSTKWTTWSVWPSRVMRLLTYHYPRRCPDNVVAIAAIIFLRF